MEEIWKTISSNENYEVSNLGNVRSKDRWVKNTGSKAGGYFQKGKTLKLCIAKNGYSVVNIGKFRTQYVHRLVCVAFIGEIHYKMTVNHKDGNKQNNRADNLEIMTYQENHLHAFHTLRRKPSCLGKNNTGPSKPVCQIKEGNVIAIFPSAREAERMTGIPYRAISACCHGYKDNAGGYKWKFAEIARFRAELARF